MDGLTIELRPTAVTPPFRIRAAGPLDIEPSVVLACAAAPERGAGSWRDALTEELQHPERLLLVVEIEREVVGYGRVRLFTQPPDAPTDAAPGGYYLTGVFIRPDRRRAGLGAAITDARLRWISERATEAWFFANARNSASIELHRRFGFEEVTRRFSFPGATFSGGEGILYRSRLSPNGAKG